MAVVEVAVVTVLQPLEARAAQVGAVMVEIPAMVSPELPIRAEAEVVVVLLELVVLAVQVSLLFPAPQPLLFLNQD
jgi:hypothetical protein